MTLPPAAGIAGGEGHPTPLRGGHHVVRLLQAHLGAAKYSLVVLHTEYDKRHMNDFNNHGKTRITNEIYYYKRRV